VHLAWVCIAETGGRIESGDVELARELKNLGLSVIVVITKPQNSKITFESEVRKEFKGIADEISLTRGVIEPEYDDDDNVKGNKPIKANRRTH
jgi:dihydrodipicolinate synthase/N-acetylneuraminate lyase